jgi:hypothetical protein
MNPENQLLDAEAAALLSELEQVSDLDELQTITRQPPGRALGMNTVATTHRQQVDQHLFADWTTRQAAATEHLRKLPKPNQSLHVITGGDYNGTDIIPAVIRLDGATCAKQCYLTTLSFSETNVKLLATMLDSGQIKRLALVCSYYFARASKAIYELAERELVPRGVRLLHTRCHCKITLLALDTGRRYVIETSANARSCICLEQLTLTQDAALFQFHRRWIEHLFATKP